MFIYLVLLLMSLLQSALACPENPPPGVNYRCGQFLDDNVNTVQENPTDIMQGNLEICLKVDGKSKSPTVPIKVGQTVDLSLTPQGGGWFGFYMVTPEGAAVPFIPMRKVAPGETVSLPLQVVGRPVGVDHGYFIAADKQPTDLEIGRLIGRTIAPTSLEKSGNCVTASFSEAVIYIRFTSEER